MKDRAFALCVSDAPGSQSSSCAVLAEAGYEVVEFVDYENASAWLEEETPEIAVLIPQPHPVCSSILQTLRERGVSMLSSANLAA